MRLWRLKKKNWIRKWLLTREKCMNFLERALPLLERGFSLIPLEIPALITDPRRGKVPLDELPGKRPATGLVPQGAKNRTRDRGTIEAWAERLPNANVGVCADENFLIRAGAG